MASFWERVGEGAGYAIGAVIFGPSAALARRERRVLRRAFHGWLDAIDAERLPSRAKGIARRSGSLRGAEPIPFEAELDPFAKRARVDVALALGRDVTAEVSKEWSRAVHIDATNLDEAAAKELVNEIAASAIGHRETFTIDLRKDRLLLDVVAPQEVNVWVAIERALAVLVETWTQRWTPYR